MNSFLDSLNLRPQERRLVVIVGVVVFVVLNLWFVRPHFGDWRKLRDGLEEARQKRKDYVEKINADRKEGGLQDQLHKLEQDGSNLPENSDIQLQRTIMAQASEAKVTINNYQPVPNTRGGATNEFFEEQSIKITVDSEEKPLVDFLYKVGDDASMIRVRDLNLKPADANRYRLKGTMTLTANYQKKPKTPSAAPAAPSSSPKKK
jgi:Tfp pilus assembly protein PilO